PRLLDERGLADARRPFDREEPSLAGAADQLLEGRQLRITLEQIEPRLDPRAALLSNKLNDARPLSPLRHKPPKSARAWSCGEPTYGADQNIGANAGGSPRGGGASPVATMHPWNGFPPPLWAAPPKEDPVRRRDERVRTPNRARPAPLVGPRPPLWRLLHGHPRRGDRDGRSSVDRGEARILGPGAPVGGERLRPHLRRLAPARRPGGRPPRAPPRVHGRSRSLHARLAPLRACLVGQGADRRARVPGSRGCGPDPG